MISSQTHVVRWPAYALASPETLVTQFFVRLAKQKQQGTIEAGIDPLLGCLLVEQEFGEN